jgi:competence protein CoiA
MKFAIFENDRIEATPRAIGFCSGCGSQLLAKCGPKTTWHWAHKGKRHCDTWWEPETEWHRNWKDKFPKEWQEVSARDAKGELHIADLKSPNGFVVEFQHSNIDPEEAKKRTSFYAPMIWIVDGVRRKTDKKQFESAIRHNLEYDETARLAKWRIPFDDVGIVKDWHELDAIVVFDFGDEHVWIMAGRDWVFGTGFQYKRNQLIDDLLTNSQVPYISFVTKNRDTGNEIARENTVRHSLLNFAH